MKWRTWLLCGGILVAAPVVWMLEVAWHYRAADQALRRDGYGEIMMQVSWHQRCPFGSWSTDFYGNNLRDHIEHKGFVCTSHFGSSSVHVADYDTSIYIEYPT